MGIVQPSHSGKSKVYISYTGRTEIVEHLDYHIIHSTAGSIRSFAKQIVSTLIFSKIRNYILKCNDLFFFVFYGFDSLILNLFLNEHSL